MKHCNATFNFNLVEQQAAHNMATGWSLTKSNDRGTPEYISNRVREGWDG